MSLIYYSSTCPVSWSLKICCSISPRREAKAQNLSSLRLACGFFEQRSVSASSSSFLSRIILTVPSDSFFSWSIICFSRWLLRSSNLWSFVLSIYTYLRWSSTRCSFVASSVAFSFWSSSNRLANMTLYSSFIYTSKFNNSYRRLAISDRTYESTVNWSLCFVWKSTATAAKTDSCY